MTLNGDANLNDAVVEILDSIIGYLPKLMKGIEDTAVLFQSGDKAGALDLFQQCVEGLSWFMEGYGEIAVNFVPKFTVNVDSEKLKNNYESVHMILKEILAGMENSDFITVSDMLEYELTPLLEEIANEIETLKEELTLVQ